MLYTNNGSIPTELPEGVAEEDHIAAGWLPVLQPQPQAPEGKEVVWLNWSWVVRPQKPEDSSGYRWKWNHDSYEWVEYRLAGVPPESNPEVLTTEQLGTLTSTQLSML